jgi:adenylyl-sulfate kinase
VAVEHLDGDEFRKTIGRDLGFTREDRNRNIERAANVAALLVKHGILVLGTFVSPYREQREMVKRIVPGAIEIFVNAPLDVCIERDPKGMYKEAKAGTRAQFTGVQQDYEIPERPDLALETDRVGVDDCVEAVIRHLYNEGILF